MRSHEGDCALLLSTNLNNFRRAEDVLNALGDRVIIRLEAQAKMMIDNQSNILHTQKKLLRDLLAQRIESYRATVIDKKKSTTTSTGTIV